MIHQNVKYILHVKMHIIQHIKNVKMLIINVLLMVQQDVYHYLHVNHIICKDV
jgi:hypothetical protein